MTFLLVQAANAGGKDRIQTHFNDIASEVKATTDPAQKREILNQALQNMSKALDRVQNLPLTSKEDRASLNRFKTTLQEKQEELAGLNGYERVADAQLNAFSDYVVQDMEQAEKNITISLVAALLIVIIIILVT
jgi:ABC-type transporter Mla subunit MlaD